MTKRISKPAYRLPKLRRSATFDTRIVWAPPSWVEEHEPIFHYVPNKDNKRDDECVSMDHWDERKILADGSVMLIPQAGWKLKTPCGLVVRRGYDVKMRGVEFPLGHAIQIGRLCKKCFPGGLEAERSWPSKEEIQKTTERLLELQLQLKRVEEQDE